MSRQGLLRVVVHGAMDADANMGVDETLLRGAGSSFDYTLRFYGWRRPTVSLGYAQAWRQGFDAAAAAREGVGLVRRRTGGRAVLHADEITYSIAGPAREGAFAGGVQATYRVVSAGLAAGLAHLGAPVDLVRSRGRRERQEPGACFATRALHEIVADGRKLLGSAQRRQGGRALQHGSLLLGTPEPRLWAVLGATGETALGASVGLHTILPAPAARRTVVAALAAGVASSLELRRVARPLTAAERRLARHHAGRYRDVEHTYRR